MEINLVGGKGAVLLRPLQEFIEQRDRCLGGEFAGAFSDWRSSDQRSQASSLSLRL